MCVIAVKKAGITWPGKRYLRNCYTNNPDGAGIAWVDDKGLHVKKGYFNWGLLYADLRALERYPVLLHCRMATHGSVSKENCHPFRLKNGAVLAHNGVIKITPLEENMTDSETFGKTFVEKFSLRALEQPHIKELLESYIGYSNKIALLKPDGNFILLNEDQGCEFGGVWFSNESFDTRYVDTYSFLRTGNTNKIYPYFGRFDYGDYEDERLTDAFYASDKYSAPDPADAGRCFEINKGRVGYV